MKKIAVIILLICICFLTGCTSINESGFGEHYDKKPYIYMGLRSSKKEMSIEDAKIELAFGWEKYPNEINRYNALKNENPEFKGIIVSVSDNYLQDNHNIYLDKNGRLIFSSVDEWSLIDSDECNNQKYFVNISGFRKPNYNHIETLKINSNILKDNKIIFVNIGQLFYVAKTDTYYYISIQSKRVNCQFNDKGLGTFSFSE